MLTDRAERRLKSFLTEQFHPVPDAVLKGTATAAMAI